ncbi:MAG: thrombospondin type 3 repeat-containing protein, partial [Kiritimatiellaeota bacterium]|nr:thrombospondin type 3 repeat-containing protein [Kiritimatiellota bacterium]
IPYEAAICPFCRAKQPEVVNPDIVSTLGDGIADKWKKTYGFDILDQTVANADTDGDGFSNLEEFRSGTNPLDPKSH